jgi:hypothetical protein
VAAPVRGGHRPHTRLTVVQYNVGIARLAGIARPAFLLVALTLAAGCSGDDGGPAWNGPQRPFTADGTISVEDFNDYADDVDEPWERSPALLAGQFLRLDEAQATQTSIDSRAQGEGTGTADVTVTQRGLLDDSIAAERYVLGLQRDGDVWRLSSATWTQSCQPGRGHEDFSPAACV